MWANRTNWDWLLQPNHQDTSELFRWPRHKVIAKLSLSFFIFSKFQDSGQFYSRFALLITMARKHIFSGPQSRDKCRTTLQCCIPSCCRFEPLLSSIRIYRSSCWKHNRDWIRNWSADIPPKMKILTILMISSASLLILWIDLIH